MIFACSRHLVSKIRETAKAPHFIVSVQPARPGDVCNGCGKKAAWVVEPSL